MKKGLKTMDEYQIRSYLMNLLKITPQSVKLILENNYEHLRQRDLFFELKNYLDKFIEKPNQNKFFVVPGLRGVGKSTLLYQIYSYYSFLVNLLNLLFHHFHLRFS